MGSGGVMIGAEGLYSAALRIRPPLCLTREEADCFLKAFGKSLRQLSFIHARKMAHETSDVAFEFQISKSDAMTDGSSHNLKIRQISHSVTFALAGARKFEVHAMRPSTDIHCSNGLARRPKGIVEIERAGSCASTRAGIAIHDGKSGAGARSIAPIRSCLIGIETGLLVHDSSPARQCRGDALS
ncbi:MAG: hypothetical protein R8G34_02985 [Paracoccaceae bacterium]|nr:hypothetical protein [Paracoccaceae bacterium]